MTTAPESTPVPENPFLARGVAPAAPNVTYMLGRAGHLPFPDGAFDAVTCSSGVHWFDQTRFLGELRRVLRPRGWVGLGSSSSAPTCSRTRSR